MVDLIEVFDRSKSIDRSISIVSKSMVDLIQW